MTRHTARNEHPRLSIRAGELGHDLIMLSLEFWIVGHLPEFGNDSLATKALQLTASACSISALRLDAAPS